ncbi:MAG: thiazole synthase [Candidatus Omnitrophica bacterium]|nr:thiazole synthase [Candidatus Omnitrophota bacterium]
MDDLIIAGKSFKSRFMLGTGKFKNKNELTECITLSGTEIVTVALRRIDLNRHEENILEYIPKHITLMTNTSGARNAEEAVRIARLAREAGYGNWIKIEVINDSKYLLPDNQETVKATEILAAEGFVVMPYMYPDLNTARALVKAGAATVMPLGSLIGSNQGLKTKEFIQILLNEIDIPIVVDAGIGRPSQAAEAMEMGAHAVLVNTAIATADQPAVISKAFALAVEAGRLAFLAKLPEQKNQAQASSPLTGFLYEK